MTRDDLDGLLRELTRAAKLLEREHYLLASAKVNEAMVQLERQHREIERLVGERAA